MIGEAWQAVASSLATEHASELNAALQLLSYNSKESRIMTQNPKKNPDQRQNQTSNYCLHKSKKIYQKMFIIF